MTPQLTTGAIKALYNDEKSSPLYNKPLVQVINIKPVSVTGGTRYRVILSDGVHFMQAMLAASHSNIVEDQSLKRNSVIQLNESVCNLLQNRKILIVLNIDIVQTDVESKIGAPTTLETQSGANTSSPSAKQEPSNQSALSGPVKSSGFSSGSGANMQLEASLTPIKNLNPYQTRWTIKARITQKSPIKKWHNAKGDGQLFSVNLLDQTGEIKATAFNDQVDRLYNIFEEGKVYYISKARVTMAKKQFSTLNNEYELGLEHGTEIEACGAESSIPQMSYDFVKIADLDKHEKGSNVDILGVVIEDQGISEIIAKATGKPTKKREITLADDSNKSIRLTLWDTAAENFDSNGSPVLACKGARVGDFNGRTLSLGGNSTFKRNPEIPEAQNLQKWYREKGNSSSFDTFSSSGMVGLGGEAGFSPSKMLTLQQAKTENLGGGDKPGYFTFRGTVVFIRTENFAYPGCPECKKKLLLEESGWRCERCMKSFKTPDYHYIITMSTEDATSQAFVSGFDDVGKTLLKMDANELMRLKESDSAAAQVVFNKALFQTFIFKIRAKQETYNDISRIKYSAIDIKPIDFVKEGEALASSIEQMFI